MAVMQARCDFIHQLVAGVVTAPSNNAQFSDKLDRWMLHPVLGVPIFLVMMYLLLMFAINVGGAFFDILAGAMFVDYPQHFLSVLTYQPS
jgi:ferrous iron transport protein B